MLDRLKNLLGGNKAVSTPSLNDHFEHPST